MSEQDQTVEEEFGIVIAAKKTAKRNGPLVSAKVLQRFRYACTIREVRLCAILNVAVLHVLIGIAHSTRRVIEEALFFSSLLSMRNRLPD